MRCSAMTRCANALFVLTLLTGTAAHAAPSSVTITGGLQSEVGCTTDFQPSCALTGLTYNFTDDAWQASFILPAGNYEYLAALNGTFDVTYGRNGISPGASAQIPLSLASAQTVKFFYDDKTHWVTDSVNSQIVTLAASFQSELGCGGDFNPACLRSWLEDVDGDGIYTLTAALPAGTYEAKVTINQSFAENYGLGGVRDGANIPIVVTGSSITFCYDSVSHILGTDTACSAPIAAVPEPETFALMLGGLGFMTLRKRMKSRKLKAGKTAFSVDRIRVRVPKGQSATPEAVTVSN